MLQTQDLQHAFVLHTDFQTGGKGLGSNSWESAKGKNLLFSLLLRPQEMRTDNFFIISQVVSLGILYLLRSLPNIANPDYFTIKWPNDIYWKDKKIGGILIENSLQAKYIQTSICGIGLNINQEKFESDAPNPISLKMISGRKYDVKTILHQLLDSIMHVYAQPTDAIRDAYHQYLYRSTGYHLFKSTNFTFCARILQVELDGRLVLEDKDKNTSSYYFKEIEFVV